ncbi:MAG: putative DNA binding domain-containing protein [Anaerolineae bacterium]|nr:putative DNA binding domain-containing protein [Anaerolineae bacterium]
MPKRNNRMQWYRVDLHLHTPASIDYKDKGASYVDILRRAEYRGIDIIAFTDHNSVGGYVAMMQEIERLEFLEHTGRALADELRLLAEYRRLLDKILVLPGFEFTATFGFHILGLFPPETSIRYIEHLLLSLNVPPEVLETGNPAAGATADVLDAYALIDNAGGLAIAAHANAAHGVAMRGLNFGGQTRIAYTQDKHVHALELTDLYRKGRGSTQRFFNGTKAEYPRRMHCIQGSDAHSLDTLKEGKNTRFGVGERVTEMLLRDRSFAAIKEMLQGTDFSRHRPYNPGHQPYDYILAAREEGASLVQSFHESMNRQGGNLHAIIADVCAFANTNGGTIYVGLSSNKSKKPKGLSAVNDAMRVLENEIDRSISPALKIEIDAQETQGKTIIRILVPYGEHRPYALNDNKIYLRDEAETNLAVRDEIVNLVRQGLVFNSTDSSSESQPAVRIVGGVAVPDAVLPDEPDEDDVIGMGSPRSGVEIAKIEERGGETYYTMRDLRNGSIVSNVTRSSARRLWHYAIKQHEGNPMKPNKVEWHGDIGLWRRYEKAGSVRYDLAQNDDGNIRIYYGVTENGMHGQWADFLGDED